MHALTSIHKTIFCSGCYSTGSKNILSKNDFLLETFLFPIHFYCLFSSIHASKISRMFSYFDNLRTNNISSFLKWDPYLVSRQQRTGTGKPAQSLYIISFELASLVSQVGIGGFPVIIGGHRYCIKQGQKYCIEYIATITEAEKIVTVTLLPIVPVNNSIALVTLP